MWDTTLSPIGRALTALTVLFVWPMRAVACALRLIPRYRRRMDSWVQMALDDPGDYAVFIQDAEYDSRRRLRNPLMAAAYRALHAFVLRNVGGPRYFGAAWARETQQTALHAIDAASHPRRLERNRERRPRCVPRRRRRVAARRTSGDDPPAEPAPALALAPPPRAIRSFACSRCPECGSVLLLASGIELCANRRCSRYGKAA